MPFDNQLFRSESTTLRFYLYESFNGFHSEQLIKYQPLLFREKLVLTNRNAQHTKMHSSGMRTARLLTVSQHALGRRCCTCPGGVSARGGVPARRCTCRGVYLPGGVPAGGHTCQGVYLPRGVSAQEGGVCIPACNGADTPLLWIDRQL